MLSFTLTFLSLALIAAGFGYANVETAAAGIARIVFFVFFILFVLSVVRSIASKRISDS